MSRGGGARSTRTARESHPARTAPRMGSGGARRRVARRCRARRRASGRRGTRLGARRRAAPGGRSGRGSARWRRRSDRRIRPASGTRSGAGGQQAGDGDEDTQPAGRTAADQQRVRRSHRERWYQPGTARNGPESAGLGQSLGPPRKRSVPLPIPRIRPCRSSRSMARSRVSSSAIPYPTSTSSSTPRSTTGARRRRSPACWPKWTWTSRPRSPCAASASCAESRNGRSRTRSSTAMPTRTMLT